MPWARRIGAGLLCTAVAAVHWRVAERIGDELLLLRSASADPHSTIRRLDVAFVRDLAPSAGPMSAVAAAAKVPTPPARPVRPGRRAAIEGRPAAPIASAPASDPETVAEPLPAPAAAASEGASTEAEAGSAAVTGSADAAPAGVDEATSARSDAEPASAPDGPPAAVAAAGAATASAAGATNFEWPPSTRLSYDIVGSVRGEIHGAAQVEWLRRDERYQVHLDVRLGLPFAPLMSRRMSSEGVLAAGGLAPRRYEEETRLAFHDPRTAAIDFSADRIVGPNGASRPTVAGVQDTASQFVQLVWRFRTAPETLVAGGRVELPLALPRRVDRWVYDILAQEPIETPVGRIEAWHLKPRRLDAPVGTMSAEVWFAPTLEYLPVRFLIRQDAETFLDLRLERLPQQSR